MIVLFTDFGNRGPYVGQMRAVLAQQAPGIPVIELFNDAPAYEPILAAYLLAAYIDEFPVGTVFLCVIDPGVGSQSRKPVALKIDGRWFVGPENGLFNVVAMRANDKNQAQWIDITWQPQRLSASFHGRDLFAPIACRLACGESVEGAAAVFSERLIPGWADELSRILYIDCYGNAMTGIRASHLSEGETINIDGQTLPRLRTFSDAVPGAGFYYENANGLLEIAVNQGSASEMYRLKVGGDVCVSRTQ